ncbi:hypothetical protein ACMYSQ_011937 [Aspergillus niger]
MSSPCLLWDYRGMKADARAGLQNKFAPGTYRSQWQGKGDEQYFCRLQRPEPSQSVENEPIGCFKSIPTGPIALLYTLFHHGATGRIAMLFTAQSLLVPG